MDSRCRARGFVKEAMASSRKTKPTTVSSCSSHVSFIVHHQERATMAPSNHRVVHEAMNVHEANFSTSCGVVIDEHIDRKAASYISSVQERFRIEGLIN